jgi:hypothetical protein
MDTDYPAAHSMDTEWFAIDKDGHVAFFISGENGAVPNAAGPNAGLLEVVQTLSGNQLGGEREVDAFYENFDESLKKAADLGLFVYEYGQFSYDFIDPYERDWQPAQPIHIDQLPPRLRELCSQVRFDSFCFVLMEHLQPLEFTGCSIWAGAAYLSSDLSTVRPVPGEENDYLEVVREAQENLPPALENVRFEGLDAGVEGEKKGGDDEL